MKTFAPVAGVQKSEADYSSHVSDFRQQTVPRNGVARKPVESARQIVTRGRHDVPGTLQRWEPAEIVGSLRAGRNVEQTRKEYNCTAAVALEVWLRDLERRLAGLARPMAMLAWVLMGVSAADVWQAAAGGTVAVERGFRRNGRARKRGLEDGPGLIELCQVAVAAGGAA
jgi:hypothetical protein